MGACGGKQKKGRDSPKTLQSPEPSGRKKSPCGSLGQSSRKSHSAQPRPIAALYTWPTNMKLEGNRSGDQTEQFTNSGNRLKHLLQANLPPKNWNDTLVSHYPVSYKKCEEKKGSYYQAIVHIDDTERLTKRQFLAFYDLQPHLMSPQKFIDWCKVNKMYNTIQDFVALYWVSQKYGQGSKCLRVLRNDPMAIDIQLTDRFITVRGVYRAVVIKAATPQAVRRLFSIYMQSLLEPVYKTLRCCIPQSNEGEERTHGRTIVR